MDHDIAAGQLTQPSEKCKPLNCVLARRMRFAICPLFSVRPGGVPPPTIARTRAAAALLPRISFFTVLGEYGLKFGSVFVAPTRLR